MMNQEDIFKKIGLILDELQDQYEFLAENPKQLNELELELFMANANFLSDHVQIVRKLNSTRVMKEIPEHTSAPSEHVEEKVSNHQEDLAPAAKEIQDEPAEEYSNHNVVEEEAEPVLVLEEEEYQQQEVVESPVERESFKLDKEPSTFEFILKDVGSTDQFEFEEKSVNEIFDRPLSKEEEEVIAQKKRIKEQEAQTKTEIERADELGPEPFLVAKEEDVVPQASTQLVLDDFERKEVQFVKSEEQIPELPLVNERPEAAVSKVEETARPTLNELLARQNGAGNLNAESSRNTITDLKQGINLNDKMLYIKDLFNGYNLAYAEVIDLLNKMPDFKAADSFLQNNYALKNNWASRQATVDKFYELLNQRFPAK